MDYVDFFNEEIKETYPVPQSKKQEETKEMD